MFTWGSRSISGRKKWFHQHGWSGGTSRQSEEESAVSLELVWSRAGSRGHEAAADWQLCVETYWTSDSSHTVSNHMAFLIMWLFINHLTDKVWVCVLSSGLSVWSSLLRQAVWGLRLRFRLGSRSGSLSHIVETHLLHRSPEDKPSNFRLQILDFWSLSPGTLLRFSPCVYLRSSGRRLLSVLVSRLKTTGSRDLSQILFIQLILHLLSFSTWTDLSCPFYFLFTSF